MQKRLPLLLLISVVSACSTTPADVDETTDWTAEKFFQEAKDALNQGAYQEAIELFNKLEARFPFGRYAQQAQLETAFAYYKYNEPKSAIAEADRFIKLNPRHPNVDYAFYLRGLSSFTEGTSDLEQAMGKKATEVDPGNARKSFDYFKELVESYPYSRYADDARQRMVYLRELLAKNELQIAQYYLDNNAYTAAANRANYVIEHYQGTHSVTNALQILVKSYQMLRLTDLADDARRVLDLNSKPARDDSKVDAKPRQSNDI